MRVEAKPALFFAFIAVHRCSSPADSFLLFAKPFLRCKAMEGKHRRTNLEAMKSSTRNADHSPCTDGKRWQGFLRARTDKRWSASDERR
jgi:hypothetical protein